MEDKNRAVTAETEAERQELDDLQVEDDSLSEASTDIVAEIDELLDEAVPLQKSVPASDAVPKKSPNEPPKDILADPDAANYQETDVFAWANNLVQYKDELKIDLFFFNKNGVVYRTNLVGELKKQLEPLFIDEILEYVLEGADNGLIVRGFEEAGSEENVLQRTNLAKVEKAKEVLNWLKTQEHEIELFNEEEHDIKRMKGIIARVGHPKMPKRFYVVKQLPQSQVMKGSAGWMIRDNQIINFDADAALRIPPDNQLLILDQDMYVFSQAKLKSLFGYDAKEASIAEKKVAEIQDNFKPSFAEGETMQDLIKGKPRIIKKLQKIEPGEVKQDDLLDHAEQMGLDMMVDDRGAIIIMDGKDMDKFVTLLNDDYMESPMTGLRYEIISKRELKPPSDDDMPVPASPFGKDD